MFLCVIKIIYRKYINKLNDLVHKWTAGNINAFGKLNKRNKCGIFYH